MQATTRCFVVHNHWFSTASLFLSLIPSPLVGEGQGEGVYGHTTPHYASPRLSRRFGEHQVTRRILGLDASLHLCGDEELALLREFVAVQMRA